MRTITFLGFAVALTAAAVPVRAQGSLQAGAFPGIDRMARIEANRIAHAQQLRHLGGQRFGRMHVKGRLDQAPGVRGGRMGARGFVGGKHMGMRAQAAAPRVAAHAGARAGFRAGVRAERLANTTPEQKAFVEQFRTQRQSIRAQVVEGKLTREQARAQMKQWVTEHRPKK